MNAIVERLKKERLAGKIIVTDAPLSKEEIRDELNGAVGEMAEVMSILELAKDYTTKFQASEPMTGIRNILLGLIPRLQAVQDGVEHAKMALARM